MKEIKIIKNPKFSLFKLPLIFLVCLLFLTGFLSTGQANTSNSSYLKIKKFFLKEIQKELAWAQGHLTLGTFRIEPKPGEIPRGAQFNLQWIGVPRLGSNVAILKVYYKNRPIRTLRIWGFVELELPVVVASRPIPKGHIITPEDVHLEKRRISGTYQGLITNLEQAIGKETKISLRAGQVLTSYNLKIPPLIKKGQMVVIVARGKNFVVKAKGIALQDGNLNQMIRVKNIQSKKVVWGKVISPEEVEVSF